MFVPGFDYDSGAVGKAEQVQLIMYLHFTATHLDTWTLAFG